MNKNRFGKKIQHIIIAVIIYIISAAILAAAVVILMYSEHTETLMDRAMENVALVEEGAGYAEIDLHSFGLLVYDTDHNCLYDVMPENPVLKNDASDLYGSSVDKYVDKVLDGKTEEVLFYASEEHIFAMFAALPVKKDNTTYAFFLIRNIKAMGPSVITFTLAYTVIYVIFATLFISLIRRRNRYLQMQQIYVANISHDLKSPITSIRALAETMHDRMPEDKDSQQKYCGFIISESLKLEHTVKDILELSSIQSQEKQYEKNVLKLSEVLSTTISKYEMLCYDMMIDFQITSDLNELPVVKTNAESISRVVDILLDNAVKFVDEDDGRISVSCTQDSRKVLVSISDNGIGMDKETQQHIFERFYMGDKAHNSRGSGLGLAIAHEIITGLGEKLYIESSPGKGSTFTFSVHM